MWRLGHGSAASCVSQAPLTRGERGRVTELAAKRTGGGSWSGVTQQVQSRLRQASTNRRLTTVPRASADRRGTALQGSRMRPGSVYLHTHGTCVLSLRSPR
jgi:hypothetical protein